MDNKVTSNAAEATPLAQSRLILGLKMFFIFLKTGSVTFAGGLAMIPVLREELCVRNKYLPEKEFVNYVAICQSLPGVISINISIMAGRKVAGVWGAFMAAFAMALPAFVSILAILLFLPGIRSYPITDGFLGGVKASATALILITTVKMWNDVIECKEQVVIALLSFIIVTAGVNVAWVILAAGLYGLTATLVRRKPAQPEAAPANDSDRSPPQMIDSIPDITPRTGDRECVNNKDAKGDDK